MEIRIPVFAISMGLCKLLQVIATTTSFANCYELITTPHPLETEMEDLVPVTSSKSDFWAGHLGEEHVAKLSSENFTQFVSQHENSFIMFYANWCRSSQEAAEEFAKVALEMAYTEGFTHIQFAALDCNGTMANKIICNKTFRIIKYPRFIYFLNGKLDRWYTKGCPRHSDYFYSWLVHGGNERYCSGLASAGVQLHVKSSAPSSTFAASHILPLFVLLSVPILRMLLS